MYLSIQQQFRSPIPQCDHNGSVRFEGRTVLPCQPEVANLENALMAEQQVRGLEVTVQYPVVMEVRYCSQKLLHQALHFS